MSPQNKRQPGPEDVPMIEVEQTFHGVHPDLGGTARVSNEFTIRDFGAPFAVPESLPAHIPRYGYAEPGVSVDVKERAQILQIMVPEIAQYAKRQKMPLGAKTAAGRQRMEALYGNETEQHIKTAIANGENNRQTLWNVLYQRLGYKALSDSGLVHVSEAHRLTSEDRNRMLNWYGPNKQKERATFQKQLDHYAPRPKKTRKR